MLYNLELVHRTEAALKRKHARAFDLTGRPMKDWVTVHVDGLKSDASLQMWADEAISFVRTLSKK